MLGFLWCLIRDALLLLGHLSGGGSFPKPLSRQEEAQALAAMQAGDETARARLIEHNLRLVAHVVRKYTVPGLTQDDLVSVGTLGLIKAVNTYKPDAKTPLSTYAARCIENEVLMQLRAAKKRRNDVSLTDPIGMDGEGNDISFQDILGTPGDMVEDAAIRHMLLGGRPLLQHEVASKMGISRSYISRIETHAIALIRDEIMGKR